MLVGSPIHLALQGKDGYGFDRIRELYRYASPQVTTLRIPLGHMVQDQYRRMLTQEDKLALSDMGDSMLDRDANLHTSDKHELGIIKNWGVEHNHDRGGRLELVIEIEHVVDR